MSQLYELAEDLFLDNFQEASSYNGELDLDVNFEFYQRYDDLGLVKFIGAFDGNGLVGYSILLEVPFIAHKHTTLAQCQVIYLKPEYRKGSNGVRFIKFVENVARAINCQYLQIGIPKKQKKVHNLFVDLGYKLREATFSRRL